MRPATLFSAAAFVFAADVADACRLALVLAMDVSNSVDVDEDALQRGGMARALLAPEVEAAFFVSSDPVNLLIFEWSGQYNQHVLVDWTEVRSPSDLLRISGAVAESTRSQRDFPTAMGYALGYAATRLREVPSCAFRTIDVAGDGKNNHGFGPAEAYAAFPFDGVTVNGLVVDAGSFAGEDGLIPFYLDNVLRGPNAFLEVASGFEDYEATLRRKLVRELMAQIVGQAPTAMEERTPRG